MPIKPKAGESKDEYIGRCIGIEINNGHPKDQSTAICITKASCSVLLVSKTTACCVTLAVKVASECTFSCKLV